MTPRPEDELDETRLQALFDRTAELPSGPMLTKLSARAADIPGLSRPRPFWQSLRFMLPAVAAVAGALAVVAIPELRGEPGAESAPVALAPQSPAPAEATAPAPVDVETPAVDEVDLDALAELDFSDGDELAFGDVDGPDSEAELDAWLSATEALLDEGG
jgi:hypothetical protein